MDDLVKRYQSGQTPREIGNDLGLHHNLVRRRLADVGLRATPAEGTRRYFSRDTALAQARSAQAIGAQAKRWKFRGRLLEHRDDIVASYEAGASLKSLAVRYECSTPGLRACLEEWGIRVRNQSEAGLMRIALDPADQAARIARMAATNTGRPIPDSTMRRRAVSHEANQRLVGFGEERLAQMLRDRGLEPVPQLAVDRYNIDLAVAPVAVEVHNAAHHPFYRTHNRRRSEDLARLGWLSAYLWIRPIDEAFICCRAADQIVTLVDLARRDPSALRQHQVVRADGKTTLHGSSVKINHPTLMPTPRDMADVQARYGRVG